MAIKSIGIDIRECDGNGAGKGRYAEEITKALIELVQNDPKLDGLQFFLFTQKPNKNFPSSDRVKQVLIPGTGVWWHLNLRKYLKAHPLDWFVAPTSYILPAIAPEGQKIALVVHDLIAFLFAKENYWLATLIERLTLGRAVRNSSLIVTVSGNTWEDLKKIKSAAKKKDHIVAPPAVGAQFKAPKARDLKLPNRYLLAVGTLQPRKNFAGIFKAFKEVAAQQKDLHLCIVGGIGWKAGAIFKSIPKNLKDRIHFLGYVPHEQLPELYARAQMLVYPSIYEGFGIPPLEAMACGCPVITSNNSSLPEVVGDAAIQVPPKDTKEITRAIKFLLGPSAHASYKKRGLRRASNFSWKASAKEILQSMA
jgi:glycosyltransferase involved in cell wall biosynthesis